MPKTSANKKILKGLPDILLASFKVGKYFKRKYFQYTDYNKYEMSELVKLMQPTNCANICLKRIYTSYGFIFKFKCD